MGADIPRQCPPMPANAWLRLHGNGSGLGCHGRGLGRRGDEFTANDLREKGLLMDERTRIEIEAATFRRLVEHLRARTDVQNIDLMNLAGFCRNCLSKWYAAEAESRGEDVDYEQARERVYGMPYQEWKVRYQTPASNAQIERFQQAPEHDPDPASRQT